MKLSHFILFLGPVIAFLAMATLLIQPGTAGPSVSDKKLKVETFVQGLASPTSMAFIDKDHIIVLQKNDGKVLLVSNGTLQKKPILQVSVDNSVERGLLGIAVLRPNASSFSQNLTSKTLVFLYYTESQSGQPLRNRVYSYEWNGQTLAHPKLILDLPALPGPNHNAGKLSIGPDGNLYAIIGELRHNGQLQNIQDGPAPDDTGVIFRVNPYTGQEVQGNPFEQSGKNSPLSRYVAYGIRNSFGITFDPVNGQLWQTENGPSSYDEINVIKPGFNGGWKKIIGPISRTKISETDLVNFPNSKYYDPVFSWKNPVAVTGLEFFNSSKFGDKYLNNLFVGDYNNGNIYFFEINKTRTGLEFNDANQSGLSDRVVDNPKELAEITFGTGFGGITDIKTGPDGYLYIVSIRDGAIYRILPSNL
jgi:aldose sugar dehydrogenase